MLENQYNVKVFKIPPYFSFNSAMRSLKTENIHKTFSELLHRSVYEYNNSAHSITQSKPVETFFGKRISTDPQYLDRVRAEIVKWLTEKQLEDIEYHNKRKTPPKTYEPGQTIFVKENKRLGTKLSKTCRQETVKYKTNPMVITESGKTVHKNNTRNWLRNIFRSLLTLKTPDVMILDYTTTPTHWS